jgi:hypothetical protein
MAQRKQAAGARRGRRRKEELHANAGEQAMDETMRSGESALREAAHAGEKPMRGARRTATESTSAMAGAAESAAEMTRSDGEAVAERLQEAGALWSELAQDAMRQNVEAAQNLMRCRTLADLMEVQSDWMRRSLDNFLSRGARLSELSARLAIDAMTRMSRIEERRAR